MPKQRDYFHAFEALRDDTVGHGAAGQPDALLKNHGDQVGVFDNVGAVVDAVDLDLSERLFYVRDAVGLINITMSLGSPCQ